MKLKYLFLFTLCLNVNLKLIAQTAVEGIWKGTSSCQIKNSSCRDEIVVYHISKDSTGDSYQLIANKIVGGKEEYMGTLIFSFNPKQRILTSVDSVRNSKWEFKLMDKEMKGTLIYKKELYRIVHVMKSN